MKIVKFGHSKILKIDNKVIYYNIYMIHKYKYNNI